MRCRELICCRATSIGRAAAPPQGWSSSVAALIPQVADLCARARDHAALEGNFELLSRNPLSVSAAPNVVLLDRRGRRCRSAV
jgi:hypothetical protein